MPPLSETHNNIVIGNETLNDVIADESEQFIEDDTGGSASDYETADTDSDANNDS